VDEDVFDGSGDSSSYLDDYASDNSSGNVAYSSPDVNGATTGAVINSSVSPLTAPSDASGGSGSYLTSLQNTLTSGLSDSVVSASEFGLGSLVDRITGTPIGTVAPAAAPTPAPTTASTLFSNPLVWVGIAVVVIYLATRK
jgi:hypothetical protein